MRAEFQTAIGEYLGVPAATIDSGFRFTGERFQGSVGMYRFMAFAKRRLARDVPALPYGCSLEEAIALLTGEAPKRETAGSAPAGAAAAQAQDAAPALSADMGNANATPGGARIGIDIERIDSMPETTDYRAHDFYRDTFAPAEIAYCLLRPEPRQHFCGLFCAKEAFLKASNGALRPGDIEIGHEPSGRPYYKRAGQGPVPRFDLSISHSGGYAVAAAVQTAEIAAAPVPQSEWRSGPAPAMPERSSAGTGSGRVLDMLLRAGLLVSIGLSLYLLIRR